MSIRILEVFIKMREMLTTHKEILVKIEKIIKKLSEHDEQLLIIFKYLEQLEQAKKQEKEHQNRIRIGFRQVDEDRS